jgi:ubiquinone/menaquinone biosynthesis C-methylase UbiE
MKKQHLIKIINSPPPDYYQQGVKNNYFQRLWHTGKLKAVLGFISHRPKKILDVGCASGWFLKQVKEKYPESWCYGVDLYEKAVNYGGKKYGDLVLKHADAHKLPFKKECFDLIICTEVLEHVVDPDKVLLEIKRVLKKNGTVVIEMDTGNLLFQAVWSVWIKLYGRVWSDAHLHLFDKKKIISLIKKSGLRIVRTATFNWSMAVVFQLSKKS